MINPTPDDIGRTVRFTPRGHDPGKTGTLVGFNDTPQPGVSHFAFVAFCADYPDMAVPLDDLSWEPN